MNPNDIRYTGLGNMNAFAAPSQMQGMQAGASAPPNLQQAMQRLTEDFGEEIARLGTALLSLRGQSPVPINAGPMQGASGPETPQSIFALSDRLARQSSDLRALVAELCAKLGA